MMRKYQRLAEHLRALPADQVSVELTFSEVDGLVSGLPASAWTLRQWWANNSQGHALAWREAGWHVDTVEFADRCVRFARGRVGGTRADRLAGPQAPREASGVQAVPFTSATPAGAPARVTGQTESHTPQLPDIVAVSLCFSWEHVGALSLDEIGKVAFPQPLPRKPGLYRLRLAATDAVPEDRFYFGETDNLHRRLAGNYRNPGPRQQTSLRVNEALRAHLAAGGEVMLAVALSVELGRTGEDRAELDLTRKAGRLLAESAALVIAHRAGLQLENLG